MNPFDYVMTLMSFVYALAIAHALATVGDLIAASNRVRFSWLNTAWMLFAILAVVVWWLMMWGIRDSKWNVGALAIFFAMSAALYLEMRLVCLRVPMEGPVDMVSFHQREGWKYMAGFAVITGLTDLINVFYWGNGAAAAIHNPIVLVVAIQCAAAVLGACVANRHVQVATTVIVGFLWAWFLTSLQHLFV